MSKANKIDQEIGEKIELERKIKRKTRKWLAQRINRSYQQVQNYESGKHRVAASCLFLIASVLKVSIEKFFPKSGSLKD
jgi:transcriptional regulator with XRE-family HTH domain